MKQAKQKIFLDTHLRFNDGKQQKLVLVSNAFIDDDVLGKTACKELQISLKALSDDFFDYARWNMTPEQREFAARAIVRFANRLSTRLTTEWL
jgi:hypothetical protein